MTSQDGAGETPPPDSPLRRALAAFAQRNPPGQPDIDYVMRSLAEHDDWYVPVLFAGRAWRQAEFEDTLLFPDAAPAPVLNVFSDPAAASEAHGQALGVYGGPVSGVQLLGSLGPELSAFVVNPASPREQQWYIAPAGFEIAVGWANTIRVERALAQLGSGPPPAAELLMHRYLVLLEKQEQKLAQVYLPDIAGTVAVCFTASDRVEEYVASLPTTVRPLVDLAVMGGPQLFEAIYSAGLAGIVVNAGSDDQAALTSEDLADILSQQVATR